MAQVHYAQTHRAIGVVAPAPNYALSERQLTMVREALVRVPPKERPTFMRMMHEEIRAQTDKYHTTVDDKLVRTSIELLVAMLEADGKK